MHCFPAPVLGCWFDLYDCLCRVNCDTVCWHLLGHMWCWFVLIDAVLFTVCCICCKIAGWLCRLLTLVCLSSHLWSCYCVWVCNLTFHPEVIEICTSQNSLEFGRKWPHVYIYVCIYCQQSMMYTGRAKKSSPLNNFANFSRTISRYDIKLYTLVTHSVLCKFGQFHYIIYRIDKIMLLLFMAT